MDIRFRVFWLASGKRELIASQKSENVQLSCARNVKREQNGSPRSETVFVFVLHLSSSCPLGELTGQLCKKPPGKLSSSAAQPSRMAQKLSSPKTKKPTIPFF